MAKTRSEPPKTPRKASAPSRTPPDYEPPKLVKFEKLEKLIVSGE